MQPEPFYKSVRFWTAVLTPIFAAVLPGLIARLPFVGTLTPEQWTALFTGAIVAGVSYIAARTVRNTKVKA